ncbi:hypothetical protein J2S10_001374 [Neobacillus ginsengisoli]|uniref:Uncharacterized protein n=1 Tax=Neobacillus ginsengisoli TaxID=904295 RepID=A0ABT9XRS0_9BACI|nr:hypothetical protein [Neobacillus ginsengisoli]
MNVYDNHFNSNEWFIVVGLCIGTITLFFLPKRFPRKTSIVFFTCGVFSGFFFDHSLSVEPVNFYDVNDNSSYQFIDFLSYVTYGPLSYLFFYFFDRLRPVSIPIYILIWSLISLGMEWSATYFGVFHYRHGYKLFYSLPIYLIVQSCWIVLYHRYHGSNSNLNSNPIL